MIAIMPEGGVQKLSLKGYYLFLFFSSPLPFRGVAGTVCGETSIKWLLWALNYCVPELNGSALVLDVRLYFPLFPLALACCNHMLLCFLMLALLESKHFSVLFIGASCGNLVLEGPLQRYLLDALSE